MKTEQRLSRLKAVIFDMDGLVLDTESTYFAAWQQAAAKMAFRLGDDFCLSLSGLDYGSVIERIATECGGHFDRDQFDRLSGICWREHVETQGIAVKKGFSAMLQTVLDKQLFFCLATNSLHHNALECLRYAGLDNTFPLVASRDSVAKGKPAPDIFYRAASLLNVPISSCLVVEDSRAGILAAKQAGARIAFIPSVLPAALDCVEAADFTFTDLGQLAEFVRLNVFDPV